MSFYAFLSLQTIYIHIISHIISHLFLWGSHHHYPRTSSLIFFSIDPHFIYIFVSQFVIQSLYITKLSQTLLSYWLLTFVFSPYPFSIYSFLNLSFCFTTYISKYPILLYSTFFDVSSDLPNSLSIKQYGQKYVVIFASFKTTFPHNISCPTFYLSTSICIS